MKLGPLLRLLVTVMQQLKRTQHCQTNGRVHSCCLPVPVQPSVASSTCTTWLIPPSAHRKHAVTYIDRHQQCNCRVASRAVQCYSQQPESDGGLLDNARLIAAFTSVGINGCLATLGAKLAGIDLWSEFRFSSQADLQLAAVAGLGLITYEFLLLAMPWHWGLHSKASSSSSSSSRSDTSNAQQPQTQQPESSSTQPTTFSRTPFNLELSEVVAQPSGDNSLSLELLRATLALQQACFVATATVMRSPPLPLPVDAGLIVLRESAKELLQRGLVVTFLAGWLADRLFEAGTDDSLAFLGRTFYTTDTCWAASAMLATLILLPPALSDAKALSLSVATNWAMLSIKGGDESTDDALLQEYRLYDALQRTVYALPARLTMAAHSLRGILRFATINAVFAATHNLAASWTLAVGTNLLLLAYALLGKQQLGLQAQPQAPRKGKGKGKPPSLKWPPE